MMKQVIKIEKELIDRKAAEGKKIYLSDIMSKFPNNCVFSKGYTGAGGTSMALNDDVPTIVAMPFVPAVEDKINDAIIDKKVYGMYGSHKDFGEMYDYVKRSDCPKICCTWDSVEAITIHLLTMGYDISGFRLVVDEWHEMFNSYIFRNKAVKGVLASTSRFSNVVYMTATPIEQEYFFDEMKSLPIIEIDYPRAGEIDIIKVSQVKSEVVKIVKEYLTGKRFGNAHFFVNNVTFIADVCKFLGLEERDVRIVCTNDTKNRHKVGDIKIESVRGELKKINFYTSKAFIGCDIFDEDGHAFIISDGKSATTAYDISTNYQQILGRIRDAKSTKATHILKETRYNYLSWSEFQYNVEQNKATGNNLIASLNGMDKKARVSIVKGMKTDYLNDNYITVDEFEGTLRIDENILNGEIVKYKTVHGDYASAGNVAAKLIQRGYTVSVETGTITDKLIAKPNKRTTFKERYAEYAEIKGSMGFSVTCENERLELLEQLDPIIKKAFDFLGNDKVEELKYVKRDVRNALIKRKNKNSGTKIVEMLQYYSGQVISVAKKNEDLDRVAGVLELDSRPKLNAFYNTKPSTTKDKKGNTVAAVQIICKKLVFTK